uniref:NB-ARC domain-containing protein n=1 Tax=Clytia hemisphaerica TaxID=252671 RepID=A0A7M5VD81_9CNID
MASANIGLQTKYPTQQQKNGFKQQLLREKSTTCLHNLFHQKFSRNPVTLYQELSQTKHKKELDKLKKKGVLKNDQYDQVFPQSQQTDSTQFDITLLFLLIRTLCGHKVPSNGWDKEPDVNDIDDIANALRLKLERNRMQHGQLSISTVEYRKSFRYLEKTLLALGCPQNELNDLLPLFEYDLPPANKNFIGRQNKLGEIYKHLNVNNKSNVVISGIPGVGKSELAKQYYVINKTNYDHVIWVNVDNIEDTFTNIASILRFHDKTNVKIIVNLLKTYFTNERVLYIYDNCTDIDQLTNYLDLSQHNIVTTQIKHWGQGFEVVPLENWAQPMAIQFLKDHLPTPNIQDIRKLTDELECHPLGLQHAVATMRQTGMSVAEYLTDLQEDKGDVLSQRVALGLGINTSVLASFLKTIKRIEKDNPEAIELLSVVGILDGTCMKEEFLERCYKRKREYNKVKLILTNYSIVERNERIVEFSHKKVNYLTIHSLYQEAIKIYIIQKNRKRHTIQKLIAMAGKNLTIQHDCNEEKLLWYNQIMFIYKQPCYRDTLLQILSDDFFVVEIMMRMLQVFSKDRFYISRYIYNFKKNDQSHPVPYLIELYFLHEKLVDNEQAQYILSALDSLEMRILIHVRSSKAKYSLLDLLYRNREFFSTKSNHSFNEIVLMDNEHWQKALEYIKKKMSTSRETFLASICYKELREYDKALELLFKIPEYDDNTTYGTNSKVQIACCMILKGKVKEGLDIIESLDLSSSYDSFRDIGRALYDVNLLEQSKGYFKKWLKPDCTHNDLDAFCKMIILQCTTTGTTTSEHIVATLEFYLSVLSPYVFCRPSRVKLLIYCRLIDQNKVEEAREYLQTEVSPEIDNQKYTGNLFRETLMLAEHWEKNEEFRKALILYRMIKSFEGKICNHENIIEDIDADIFKNAELKINDLNKQLE